MKLCLDCGVWFHSTFSMIGGKYIIWLSLSSLKKIWQNLLSLPLFGQAGPAVYSWLCGTYDFKCLTRGYTGAENLIFFSFFFCSNMIIGVNFCSTNSAFVGIENAPVGFSNPSWERHPGAINSFIHSLHFSPPFLLKKRAGLLPRPV